MESVIPRWKNWKMKYTLAAIGLYALLLFGNINYNNYRADQARDRFDNIVKGLIEGDAGKAIRDCLEFKSRVGNLNPFD